MVFSEILVAGLFDLDLEWLFAHLLNYLDDAPTVYGCSLLLSVRSIWSELNLISLSL